MAIGEVNSVSCELKFPVETKSIICLVVMSISTFNTIRPVYNVFPTPYPTISKSFIIPSGIRQYSHALVVQRILFDKIHYIEFYIHVFFSVLNSKEEPLSMPFCIHIILK